VDPDWLRTHCTCLALVIVCRIYLYRAFPFTCSLRLYLESISLLFAILSQSTYLLFSATTPTVLCSSSFFIYTHFFFFLQRTVLCHHYYIFLMALISQFSNPLGPIFYYQSHCLYIPWPHFRKLFQIVFLLIFIFHFTMSSVLSLMYFFSPLELYLPF
jgi:hypothetical protein